MSIQRDLTDYGTEPDADGDAEGEPLIDTDPDDHRTCQRCGTHVSARYRRTAGDDAGRVHGCPNCYGTDEILRGAYQEGEDGEQDLRTGGVRR